MMHLKIGNNFHTNPTLDSWCGSQLMHDKISHRPLQVFLNVVGNGGVFDWINLIQMDYYLQWNLRRFPKLSIQMIVSDLAQVFNTRHPDFHGSSSCRNHSEAGPGIAELFPGRDGWITSSMEQPWNGLEVQKLRPAAGLPTLFWAPAGVLPTQQGPKQQEKSLGKNSGIAS